jgi:hypothetical protein
MGVVPSFLLVPKLRHIPARAVILVRQEMPLIATFTRSPFGLATRSIRKSKSIADKLDPVVQATRLAHKWIAMKAQISSGGDRHEKDHTSGSCTAPADGAQLARACVDVRTAGTGVRPDCEADGKAGVCAQVSGVRAHRRMPAHLCVDRNERHSISRQGRLQGAVRVDA